MAKVDFVFDIEKDAFNYWETANSNSKWGRDFTKNINPELIEKLKGKNFQEVKDFLLNMLQKGYLMDKDKNEKKAKEIKFLWGQIQDKYFQKLQSLTSKKIFTENFKCIFTTIGRCPYNIKENSFMVNIFWDHQRILTSIAHEIMHLHFHHYYEINLKKQISKEQFSNIKESLTVLLNIEFGDILKYEDKGYPNHEKLRDFIKSSYEKNRGFDLLINNCVNFVKINP